MPEIAKVLSDSRGNIFLSISIDPVADLIYARWKGKVSLDDLKKGAQACLDVLEQAKVSKLLSDTSELETSWQTLNDWVEYDWTPEAQALGLQGMALIVSPIFFVKLSAVDLIRRISHKLEVRIFNDAGAARRWLAEVPSQSNF